MIDIVIVNWNAGDHLRTCIQSLAALPQRLVEFNVIIVDNASTDDSLSGLPVGNLHVRVIRNASNMGFAAACNQGARAGSAHFILFLNPDTIVRHISALTLPVEEMNSASGARVAVCGVQLVDEKFRVGRTSTRFPTPRRVLGWIVGAYRIAPSVFQTQFILENDHLSDADVDVVMGAFFFVRRNVFDTLGGFDERYFVYYEEVDFSRRALSAGFRTRFLAGASVIHSGHGTTDGIRTKRYFLVSRSRMIYGFLHFSRPAAFLLAAMTIGVEPIIRVAFFVVTGNFRAARESLGGARMLLAAGLRTPKEQDVR